MFRDTDLKINFPVFKKFVKRLRDARFVPWLLSLVVRFISATCRIKSKSLDPGSNAIYAFLHGDQIGLIIGFMQIKLIQRGYRLKVLISPSRDGLFAANAVSNFGIEAIFASSSHTEKGFAALRQMIRDAKNGTSKIAIAIDGPKGPFGIAKDGVIMVHKKSKISIRCLKVEASRYWELRSWDRMRIPKPFSKIVIHSQDIEYDEQSSYEDTKSLVEALCSR